MNQLARVLTQMKMTVVVPACESPRPCMPSLINSRSWLILSTSLRLRSRSPTPLRTSPCLLYVSQIGCSRYWSKSSSLPLTFYLSPCLQRLILSYVDEPSISFCLISSVLPVSHIPLQLTTNAFLLQFDLHFYWFGMFASRITSG